MAAALAVAWAGGRHRLAGLGRPVMQAERLPSARGSLHRPGSREATNQPAGGTDRSRTSQAWPESLAISTTAPHPVGTGFLTQLKFRGGVTSLHSIRSMTDRVNVKYLWQIIGTQQTWLLNSVAKKKKGQAYVRTRGTSWQEALAALPVPVMNGGTAFPTPHQNIPLPKLPA